MPFSFGARSLKLLSDANTPLVRVITRALQVSGVDFGVIETLRSSTRQIALVKSGASQTYNSRHMTDINGKANAADLAAYVDTDDDGDKEFSFAWPHAIIVAGAMQTASIELKIRIRWGGVWDRTLDQLNVDLEHEIASYVMRRKVIGKTAFADGPHFELPL